MLNPLSNPAYLLPPIIAIITDFTLLMMVWKLTRRSAGKRVFMTVIASLLLWSLFVFLMRASPDVDAALKWQRLVAIISC